MTTAAVGLMRHQLTPGEWIDLVSDVQSTLYAWGVHPLVRLDTPAHTEWICATEDLLYADGLLARLRAIAAQVPGAGWQVDDLLALQGGA